MLFRSRSSSRCSGQGYASAQEGFRTVVSHELFHAVQNTYKRRRRPVLGRARPRLRKGPPELADFGAPAAGVLRGARADRGAAERRDRGLPLWLGGCGRFLLAAAPRRRSLSAPCSRARQERAAAAIDHAEGRPPRRRALADEYPPLRRGTGTQACRRAVTRTPRSTPARRRRSFGGTARARHHVGARILRPQGHAPLGAGAEHPPETDATRNAGRAHRR